MNTGPGSPGEGNPSTRCHHICLIGSGGVGTIASLVLTKSRRAQVTAVLRSKYRYVSRHGWDIDSIDHGQIRAWQPHRVVSSVEQATTASDGTAIMYDFVVVCTKQTPARDSLTDLIAPVVMTGKTTIVLIQNGIGIESDIIKAWPQNVVLSSVSHIGSEVRDPNVVVQIGKDISKIGPHFHVGVGDSESMARATEFVKMYLAGGASSCDLVASIQLARWEKLLWNGTFNTLCALMRMNVGELQRSKGRETMLLPMMTEIRNVAQANGYAISESVFDWTAYRLPDDCSYRPSMLLDAENGRPMELEVILGNAIRKGDELGSPTPILKSVYSLLKIEEWKTKQKQEQKTKELSGNLGIVGLRSE